MSGIHVFTLAGIPVWVSPWYLLLLASIVMPGRGQGMRESLIFALCITVSLLGHELGHALVARYFKLKPQILLHGLGGLTGHERPKRDRDDALIVAAGPFTGLFLSLLSLLVAATVPVENPGVAYGLFVMMRVNFIWSLFNLLPLWPMDGGQLMRLGASKLLKPARGERVTHIISIAVVVLLALATQVQPFASWIPIGGPMLLIILGLMAFQNVQAMQAQKQVAPVRRENPIARDLLSRAEAAYQQNDDDQAARFCHQIKGETNVPPQVMARAWAMLGVIATRKGEYQEALSYLRRAPDLPDVVEATAQCFYQLEMYEALEALISTRAFTKLPAETREAVINALEEGTRSAARTSSPA